MIFFKLCKKSIDSISLMFYHQSDLFPGEVKLNLSLYFYYYKNGNFSKF